MRHATLLLFAALALTGCSAGGDGPERGQDGAWAKEYNAALANASTDFERDALTDGVISRAEYDEANQLWLECMDGYFPPGGAKEASLDKKPDGYYQYGAKGFGDDLTAWDAASDDCSKGTTDQIGSLFEGMAKNPGNLSGNALMAQCLVRNGYVPEWYTANNYAADTQAADPTVITINEDGTQSTSVAEPPDQDLVTGFGPGSPGYDECLLDPAH